MFVRERPAYITSITCTLQLVSPHKIAVRDAHFFHLPHAHVLGLFSSSVHLSVSLSLSLSLDIISIHERVFIHAKHTRTHTNKHTHTHTRSSLRLSQRLTIGNHQMKSVAKLLSLPSFRKGSNAPVLRASPRKRESEETHC